jgi:hypothetical protein
MAQNENLEELMKVIRKNIEKLMDLNSPACEIILRREGYVQQDPRMPPEAVVVHMEVKMIGAVVQLPLAQQSSLILPRGVRPQMSKEELDAAMAPRGASPTDAPPPPDSPEATVAAIAQQMVADLAASTPAPVAEAPVEEAAAPQS